MLDMINQLASMFIYLIAIMLLLVFNEFIYRRFGLKGENTRKFAHITATLSTIPFPYLFKDHIYPLILAIIFFIILFVSRNGTHLKSIHDIDRKSSGSYILPLSIYLTFLISNLLENKFMYILPILIMAISDPMAGIVGMNLKRNNIRIQIPWLDTTKTVAGSGAFFLSCIIISMVALYFNRMVFDLKTVWLALCLASLTTLVEFFSFRGTDNFFVPMSAVLMLVLLL